MTRLGLSLPEGAGVTNGGLSDRLDALGVVPAYVPIWCTWGVTRVGPPDGRFPAAALTGLRRRGIAPVVYWQPDRDAGEHASVLRGDWDDYITGWATDARAWGHQVLVRFAHEQNGDWFRWSPGKGTNTPASFIAMWRYVVDMVGSIAPDVNFWWCPNAKGRVLKETWPGDGWVDVVGLDGYAWTQPLKPASIFLAAGMHQLDFLSERPVIIGEFGCASGGDRASRAAWLRNAMRWFRMKRIEGAIYFDIDMRPKHPDWSLDAEPRIRDIWVREASR
jgi:mannan endo-1,4-beta-mannosidase